MVFVVVFVWGGGGARENICSMFVHCKAFKVGRQNIAATEVASVCFEKVSYTKYKF